MEEPLTGGDPATLGTDDDSSISFFIELAQVDLSAAQDIYDGVVALGPSKEPRAVVQAAISGASTNGVEWWDDEGTYLSRGTFGDHDVDEARAPLLARARCPRSSSSLVPLSCSRLSLS